jgi:hypothetical protein
MKDEAVTLGFEPNRSALKGAAETLTIHERNYERRKKSEIWQKRSQSKVL